MNLLRNASPARLSALLRRVCPTFFRNLMDDEFIRQTNNYATLTWLGNPIWQNVADLWVTQEVISALRPSLIIETGTNRGGSSLFYAHLMDLLGHGSVITMDVEKMHDIRHPRVTCLIGDSTAESMVSRVREAAEKVTGHVLVILDSDHSSEHVRKELTAYHSMVTQGSYVLVQDGITDTLPAAAAWRPGPLPAIEAFLAETPSFAIDQALCHKFPISHHPKGWLRKLV
jgi:cephalosporin hydroxylase